MKLLSALFVILFSFFLFGCFNTTSHTKAVYMLLDTSGTYKNELDKAENIINYLLSELNPGDTLAVARIDSGSFSEKDIVGKVTFDTRPSYANRQKVAFHKKISDFVSRVQSSRYTDITGGLIQAVDFLHETKAGTSYILIFSDLKEELPKDYTRKFPTNLDKFKIVALNVTKLRSDNMDPEEYKKRKEDLTNLVQDGGGEFEVLNDLERLDKILK